MLFHNSLWSIERRLCTHFIGMQFFRLKSSAHTDNGWETKNSFNAIFNKMRNKNDYIRWKWIWNRDLRLTKKSSQRNKLAWELWIFRYYEERKRDHHILDLQYSIVFVFGWSVFALVLAVLRVCSMCLCIFRLSFLLLIRLHSARSVYSPL